MNKLVLIIGYHEKIGGGKRMATKRTITAMLYGLGTILIIVLAASLILSLLLKFTEIEEASLKWIIMTLSVLALFMGGIVSGRKNKEKGWLIGGGTGLLFTLLVFLVQFLGYKTSFTLQQTLYHLGYIMIAIVGGIIGVNLASKRKAS